MRVASFSFRASDKRRLRMFLNKAPDRFAHIRGLAVYGVCCGTSPTILAQQLQVSVQAIYKWVRLYCADHDPASLLSSKRSGRPRTNKELTRTNILEALQAAPHGLGYSSGTWTVANLAHYLSQRHGILIGEHTLRRRMKEIGLRYKRPKYVYEEKEPNLAQKKGRSPVS